MMRQSWIDRLLHRRRIYDDLAEEVRLHIEEKTDAFVRAGMSLDDARLAARRAFGNVTNIQERSRDVWQWPTLESVLMDVHYATRQLRRTPTLSGIIVATLAIGIAATATVFSWTRSVLLDPLPGAGDASRVYALETTSASGSWTPTSWPDYRDFRRYLKSFDGLAATYPTALAVGDDAHAERDWGELVSSNFFSVLRVRPALGSFFPVSAVSKDFASDEAAGAQPSIVISYDFWQRRWHGDSAIVGRVVDVNRFPFTVIGVAPRTFHGSMPGEQVDLWVPAGMLGQIVPTGGWWLNDRGTRTFRVLARLRDDVGFAAARQEVERFTAFMASVNGGSSKGMGGRLMPLWQSHWGVQDALRGPLIVLLAACGLVLLIVCANSANLLLARATAREREFGLRVALGAPRRRLLRQLLTETSLLVIFGSAIGLAGASWLAHSLNSLVPAFAAPSLTPPRVDGWVLAFTILLAGGVTVIAGIAPALHGSREAFAQSLHGSAHGAVGGGRSARMRRALVMAEMALAVVSLVGAGLFYESFRRTRAVSPGFDADHVAMASVNITLAGFDSARGEAYLEDVANRIRREPGVTSAAYTDYVPLSLGSGSWENLDVEGYAPPANENMKLNRAAISPGYFSTLHIPFVAGRDFTGGDDSAHAAVMIVNEAFAQHFLAGRAALGVRVRGWGRWFTIVGVAKDSKTYRVTDAPTSYFYVPVRQVYRPEYGYTVLARTAGSVDEAVRTIQRDVRAVDPTVPVHDAMPLASYIQAPLQTQEAATGLLVLLAAIASVLAAIGLYGIVAFAMAQRTRELGLRIALGAQASDVLRIVASQTSGLLGVGLVVGLGAAFLAARLVASMLYHVGAGDLVVFGGAAVVMLVIALIALIATSVPARRALGVDPLTALRAE